MPVLGRAGEVAIGHVGTMPDVVRDLGERPADFVVIQREAEKAPGLAEFHVITPAATQLSIRRLPVVEPPVDHPASPVHGFSAGDSPLRRTVGNRLQIRFQRLNGISKLLFRAEIDSGFP